MKKKGLIISTVVMVVVLIASLTTATYAWISTNDKTTIDGFNVEVVSGNAVNIGLKKNNTYEEGAIDTAFVSGDCTFTKGTDGSLGGNGAKWEGVDGLSATISHGIIWGAQSQSVGVTTETTKDAATIANTGLWNATGGKLAIAANIGQDEQTKADILTDKNAAVANKDFAYLFLGAQPTKELTSNELIIAVDARQSINIGILSAIHVAYRVNSNGAWTDVDLFGADDPDTTDNVEGVHYNQKVASLKTNLTDTRVTAYQTAYGETPATGVYGIAIPLTALKTTDAIDQIEIVVYIAGTESDCIDQAKGSIGTIQIFFNAVAKV